MHEYKLLYQFPIVLFTLQNKVYNLTNHRFVICVVICVVLCHELYYRARIS
jgi:hypothetical protein